MAILSGFHGDVQLSWKIFLFNECQVRYGWSVKKIKKFLTKMRRDFRVFFYQARCSS